MNAKTFNKIRKTRINRQAKEDSLECKAQSYGIMSATDMNRTQALLSAYVVSGRGNLVVNKIKIT